MDGNSQDDRSINNPQRIEYEIVAGTLNLGIEYEWKVAALLSLRCLREVKEDWWIATQVEHVGAFDDLILHCGNTTYLIQLKHQNFPTNIKEEEFLSCKPGNFFIEKYVKSISKIKESVESCSKASNITERFENFSNLYFLLYTNRGVHKSSSLNVYEDNALSVLNTGIGNNVYKFNSSSFCSGTDVDCFNNLILFSSQVSVENIDSNIVAQIKKYVKRGNHAKVVAERFITFFEKWRKCPTKVNFCLTKTDVACKLSELIFNLYKIDLRLEPYVSYADNYYTSCKKVWNEVISDKILTVVDSDENTRKFLIEYISSELDSYYARCSKTITWSHILTREEQRLFYQINDNLKNSMLKTVGTRQEISLLDIYDCLWASHKVPVLLELTDVQIYHTVMSILKLSDYRFKVILISTIGKPLPLRKNKVKYFETLEDLEEKHREEILKLTVFFQGRPNAVLRDLVDENLLHHLSAKCVINILQNDFKIGNCFKSLPDYHIERALSKVLVDSKILNKLKDEILVVEGTLEEDLNVLTLQNSRVLTFEEVDFNNLSESCVIFSNNTIDQKQLELIKYSKKTAHMLTVYNEQLLKWKGSFGCTQNLRQFLVEIESLPVSNFLNDFSDKVQIISGTPGMGKSILMDYIAHKTSTHKWVCRIDLNKHTNYYRDVACDTDETTALAHLRYFKDKSFEESNCSNEELANGIFERLSTRKDVVVLLDGFDEISICYKEQVTNIAKSFYKEGFDMLITTRPALKVHLEEHFSTFSTELIPFTKDNQKQFLMCFFRVSNSDLTSGKVDIVQIFVDKLLAAVKVNLTKEDDSFTGIPLQTRLLAEYFNNYCRECLVTEDTESFSPIFNLVDLYRNFIDRKIEILVGKYGNGAEGDRRMFIEDQMIISLNILFPQYENVITNYLNIIRKNKKNYCNIIQNAQRDGILTVDAQFNVNFVHQTFAEFLAAEWLVENCVSEDEQQKEFARSLIKERFTGSTYKFLFNIFDRLLAHKHPFHLTIINRQINEAIRILNSENVCLADLDEGKRSVLHIAALYGVQHRSLSENMLDFILRDPYGNEPFTNIILKIVDKTLEKENFVFQPDILGYNPFDYALTNGALCVAASICRRLKTLSPTVNIDLDFKEYYLLYSASNSTYEPLFNILLKYFVYKDLSYGNVHQNTTINDYFSDIVRKISFKYAHHWEKKYVKHEENKLFHSLERSLKFKCDTVIEFLQLSQVGQIDLLGAALFGTDENVQLLISDAVDVNEQDPEMNTAMHYAAFHGRLKIVTLLLSNRGNIDLPNINGETVLHFAIKAVDMTKVLCDIKQQIPIIALLSDNSTNINAENNEGETPLHYVFKQPCIDLNSFNRLSNDLQYVMALLIIAGADVNIANKKGETTLHYLIINGYEDILANILDWTAGGSSPKQHSDFSENSDNTGESLLFDAVKQNRVNLLGVNTKNSDGNTLLHIAADKKNLEIVTLLVKNGASANIRNKRGYTASAIEKFHNPTFEKLFKDTDNNTCDTQGNTPLHVALKQELFLTANDLISSGASINAINNQKQTIYHCACESGLLLDIPELLQLPPKANDKQDWRGNTPLHISLLNDHSSVANFLISKGADVNITNNIEETALSYAVKNHLVDVIPHILLTTKDINRRHMEGYTCLHLSLQRNQRSIVKLLIDSGADVDLAEAQGETALHFAARFCSDDILQLILLKCKDINKKNTSKATALHLALSERELPNALLLVKRGADVNAEDAIGKTALHWAIENNLQSILKLILPRCKDINKKTTQGYTPLHLSVMRKDGSPIANLLMSQGADVNIKNEMGHLALHYAVQKSLEDVIPAILYKTKEKNMPNKYGNTPLHVALIKKESRIAKMLLSGGADVNLENLRHHTALQCAVEYGVEDVIADILTKTEEKDKRDLDGNTPLHVALNRKRSGVARALVSAGADVNLENAKQQTAIQCAVENGIEDVIADILTKTEEKDKRDIKGNTPLHLALLRKQSGVAKVLVSAGADVNLKNSAHRTALHCAAKNGLEGVVEDILKKTKDKDKRDVDGNTALHLALIQKQIGVARVLISAGANVNLENSAHRTALHCAVENGLGVVEDILNKTKEKNKRDIDGNTPLQLALIQKKSAIAKTLLKRGIDVNLENRKGHTALRCAIVSKLEDIIPDILPLVTVIDKVDNDGNTDIHLALIEKQHSIAKLLIAAGACTNAKNAVGRIALHYAVEGCPGDLLHTIVEKTGNIDTRDYSGNTPLHVAVRAGNIEAVKALLLYQANLDMKNDEHFSAHHLAFQTKNEEIQHLFQKECVNRCYQSASNFTMD